MKAERSRGYNGRGSRRKSRSKDRPMRSCRAPRLTGSGITKDVPHLFAICPEWEIKRCRGDSRGCEWYRRIAACFLKKMHSIVRKRYNEKGHEGTMKTLPTYMGDGNRTAKICTSDALLTFYWVFSGFIVSRGTGLLLMTMRMTQSVPAARMGASLLIWLGKLALCKLKGLSPVTDGS